MHQPVLLNELVAALDVKPSGFYVDGTFGRGGHSRQLLSQLGEQGRVLAIDKDPEAREIGLRLQQEDPRFTFWHGSFADIGHAVSEPIDGLMLDLGVSSPQLDDGERGFSFQKEGLLDMRMDNSQGQTAAEWLNTASEEEIADTLWRYGEERKSRQIASRIVRTRETQPLRTTLELAELISSVVYSKERHKHPATRSFQAIRIRINSELDDLERVLAASLELLAIGGRLAVISFHSLEDRIVKQFMRQHSRAASANRRLPQLQTAPPPLKLIGKPVRASDDELAVNTRSRSAVLRVAEKVAEPSAADATDPGQVVPS